MTVKEAALLVIQAGALGRGGEIFILDMGDPIRIADLAENLIALAGYEPGRDIAIRFTGLRPGEKRAEELVHPFEERLPTAFEKIGIARAAGPSGPAVVPRLAEIERAADSLDDAALRALLASLVAPDSARRPS
jgi:FlaA1/EpsC-like NDP-sugar epimerase